MANPPNVRRLRTEDFKPEERDLISRVSYALNEFIDQTIFLLNKRIDFKNLNQQYVQVDVSINSAGNLVSPITIKSELNGRAIGVQVINATNNVDTNVIPTSMPFVQFTINTGIIKILNVSGLQTNSQYKLSLLIIGENV